MRDSKYKSLTACMDMVKFEVEVEFEVEPGVAFRDDEGDVDVDAEEDEGVACTGPLLDPPALVALCPFPSPLSLLLFVTDPPVVGGPIWS